MTTSVGGASKGAAINKYEADATSHASTSAADVMALPPPVTSADDPEVALLQLMMRIKHQEGVQNDAAAAAAEKEQSAAHDEKIAKMHEAADAAFSSAMIDGVMDLASGAASAASAGFSYQSAMKSAGAEVVEGEAKKQILQQAASKKLTSSLLEAGSRAASGGGKLATAAVKREADEDRVDQAVAEKQMDAAKARADAASSASHRAQEDIRDLISAIRSFVQAKDQAARAAIRG